MVDECLDLTFLKEIPVGLSEQQGVTREEGTPGIHHWATVQQRGAQSGEGDPSSGVVSESNRDKQREPMRRPYFHVRTALASTSRAVPSEPHWRLSFSPVSAWGQAGLWQQAWLRIKGAQGDLFSPLLCVSPGAMQTLSLSLSLPNFQTLVTITTSRRKSMCERYLDYPLA